MSEQDWQLLRGTLDTLLLQALDREPGHGYALVRWIAEVTGGKLAIEEGALYNALHRLEARGYVKSKWGLSENNRRAKYYRLTTSGRRRLSAARESWESYADAVNAVFDTAD